MAEPVQPSTLDDVRRDRRRSGQSVVGDVAGQSAVIEPAAADVVIDESVGREFGNAVEGIGVELGGKEIFEVAT